MSAKDTTATMSDFEEKTAMQAKDEPCGSLSFEVILSNAPLSKPMLTPRRGRSLNACDINEKLKAAEERRHSMHQQRKAEMSIQIAKINEASKKRKSLNDNFINQTKSLLSIKMEAHIENRRAKICELKEKLTIHSQLVEKIRDQLEEQKCKDKLAIEEKLMSAQYLRSETNRRRLERLREHNIGKVAEIKSQIEMMEVQKKEMQSRLMDQKFSAAKKNREKELKIKMDKAQKLHRRNDLSTATNRHTL